MNVLPLLDELQVIARNGLRYSGDPHDAYDKERYERILHLVSEWYGRSCDLPPESVRERLTVGEFGHITPKVGATAAVFDDEGRILLMQQPDGYEHGGGAWAPPGGYCDSGESPEETAVREANEETTLDVRPAELVDVYYHEPPQNGPHGGVTVCYLCESIGGTPRPSHESQAVRYWRIDDVPAWFNIAERVARDAYREWRSREATDER